MGTISDKLMRIINTKEDIRQALISKGYDVPTSIPFKEYAKMISDLPCRVDSFPDIEGIVARYSALDLTNEQMAANPVWVDKTGNGHDLQMKNFLWGGMSGVGGYKFNFKNSSEWGISVVQVKEHNDNRIVINNRLNAVQLSYKGTSIKIVIKLTGVEENNSRLKIYDDIDSSKEQSYNKDGIYEIDYIANDGANYVYFYITGGNYGELDLPITIEQLPLYPGALVFDGVDDYGVCDNFPILTKEKGYTVVALRKYITPDPKSYLISNGDVARLAAFLVEGNFPTIQYWNFGAVGNLNYIDNLPYVYQTSKEYNGRSINKGDLNEGIASLLVCKYGSWYSNAAIWEIVILDHDATEEELTKIKDYFVKTYPWLFPDQAWTVTGKTNEDEDRATIANITGNGNDLILSNFGFAEGSGYGLYGENYNGGRWVKSTDRADITWTSYSVNVTSVKIASTQLYYQSYPEQPSFTVSSYKIKVYGLEDGQTLSYKQVTSEGQQIYEISEDGIYTLPSFLFIANGNWYGFTLNKVQESCDITIEQIPEYEGYLVTDGVDDKIDSSAFKMGEDFTVVGEWKLLPVSNYSYAGIIKTNNLYVYNNASIGISIYVCSSGVRNDMEGLKSLKAICSDGRVYGEDWTEYKLSIGRTKGAQSSLYLGYNSKAYTKMIFKNLGIYNNQILSKEDCIKAYNYLQTLKSK